MTKKEIVLILILIIIAIVRFFFFLPKPLPYENAIDKQVNLEGIVTSVPDVRLANQRITITPTNQESSVVAVIPNYLEINYGDKVNVEGKLMTPENFMTNAGKEFNYVRYLHNQNVYFIINNANVEVISKGNGNKIKSILYKLSSSFQKNMAQSIPSPESDLASGLLLGSRGGFDTNARNEFINTGTIHIIALSGYNVTIVATQVMRFLELFLAQTVSIFCGGFIILLFILMTGATSTAIRAGIMASIALTAKLSGRNYNAGRALIIAAFLMIAYDARVLTDISFQLSFLATGGILFITPKVMKWLFFIPIKFKLRENMAVTISAVIATLPILLYSTGILSFVSIPANILIIPFIPITMLLAFIAGIIGFISSLLAIPFGIVAYLPLKYILSMIHFFASLPFASTTIKSFPLFLMIALYTFLIWWVFIKKEKLNPLSE